MANAEPQRGESNAGEPKYRFGIGDKEHILTYQQAFSYGHTLLEAGHLEKAVSIFKMLAKVSHKGPRAKIMLARCQAGLAHFAACQEVLDAVFEGAERPIAEELQNAFVFYKIGMHTEAIRSLAALANKYHSLPTLCLVLGDMFHADGKTEKAELCWRLAIKRDRLSGEVALTARKQIAKLTKPRSASRPQTDRSG
jgi:thioredoxin-like negative regulator of GroEL